MATPSPIKPIRMKTSRPLSYYPYGRVHRSRGSPHVQRLQSTASYVDFYTNSPLADQAASPSSVTHSKTNTETATSASKLERIPVVSTSSTEQNAESTGSGLEATSDPFVAAKESDLPTMPASARWIGVPGFGVKHVNDPMLFNLWEPTECKFRGATREEGREIIAKFEANSVGFYGYLMILEVANPPKPVPLTIAGMPAIFTPIGEGMDALPNFIGYTGYVNPRGGDACPLAGIRRYVTPTMDQIVTVLEALSKIMNFHQITFFPEHILVELDPYDGREYARRSLPAYASGLNLTYYHRKIPYRESVQNAARQQLLNPSTYVEGLENNLPQDNSNYLQQANGGLLTPGIRVSNKPPSGQDANANAPESSTCGARVKYGTKLLVTASNHSFLLGKDVYHPSHNGEKIGEVVDQYPEHNIAFIELTPAHADRFSNESYFQAEAPRRLAADEEFAKGTWFEVDSMSTGLMSLLYLGQRLTEPPRLPGQPAAPFNQWRRDPVFRLFGAISPDMMAGMCGAPIVEERTGKVAGFFYEAVGGDEVCCAGVDDLIAEGIELA